MSAARVSTRFATIAVAALLAACGGGGDQQTPPSQTTQQPSAAANAGPLTPAAGGKVITVEMTTDGEGSYFKPRDVHANRGNVVRYTLKVGVHNVHFLAGLERRQIRIPRGAKRFPSTPRADV